MAISIPYLGGILSRFSPARTNTQTQTQSPKTAEQPIPSVTETQRVQGIQELNQAHRESLNPTQALKLDEQYLNSSAEGHPNTREATPDEIVGERFLGDNKWFAKRDAEVKGVEFQDTAPNLYDTAKEVLPQKSTIDSGEGKV